MEKSQSTSSHQRLRELLAIPERQRTEAQWAEINELEIMLTPANRVTAPEQAPGAKRLRLTISQNPARALKENGY